MHFLSLRAATGVCLGALGALAMGGQSPAIAQLSAQSSSPTQENTARENASEESAQPSRLLELIRSVPERPAERQLEAGVAQQAIEEPIKLVLRLSDRRVYVYQGEQTVKSYPVAIGRPGWETPTGEFSIKARVRDPGWTNPITNEVMAPGPDNPLGDRWMAFWTDGSNAIGFHGTPNRESIGQAASHGCVRMYNEHARELFEMVTIGTPVVVEP